MKADKGRSLSVALLSLAALFCGVSTAADYPVRAIRLVVPFPPGGALDLQARLLAPPLGVQLGQAIVVENRPGANGIVGFDAVAKAAPDGYTLLLGSASGVAVNPVVIPNLPYAAKDFAPVAMLARGPSVLIVDPKLDARSVRDLIALAKASPGKLSYGSPGTGNPNHIAAEMFKSAAGVELVHVPYKGAALVINDVIAGHLPVAFVILSGALPQLRTGKIKALAVTGAKRSPAAPDVPTMAEAGVPGVEIAEWSGILVRSGTPNSVVSRLHAALRKVLDSPEVQARFKEQGVEAVSVSADEFAAIMSSDIERLGRIVRKLGIRAE
jgi:tripartite-type tricarboxylate transporter receptor subunit TctC